MVEVIITYKLRPGASQEDYRKWSMDIDQPTASRQPGVVAYRIIEVDGAAEGEPWCDVVETIQVETREDWERVATQPEMQPVLAGFRELCDPDSVRVIYGREIV